MDIVKRNTYYKLKNVNVRIVIDVQELQIRTDFTKHSFVLMLGLVLFLCPLQLSNAAFAFPNFGSEIRRNLEATGCNE